MRALLFVAALVVAPITISAAFAEPVNYTLDPRHSQIGFTVDRFGFNNVLGRFDAVTGTVVLDEANPSRSSVHAVVQMANFNSGDSRPLAADCPTTPPAQGTPQRPECSGGRDEHLEGTNWLKVAQFPTMEFRSTSVQQRDATHATVVGNLTMMGQTHPLTLEVTLNKIGPLPNRPDARAAGFTATGTLRRSEWGVSIASGRIGEDVRFTIEALAVPAAPAAPAR